MAKKQIEPFRLVIVDEDQKLFAVEGPMTSERYWVDLVCEAQQLGRKVHCSAGPPDHEGAVRYRQRLGYRLVEGSQLFKDQLSN